MIFVMGFDFCAGFGFLLSDWLFTPPFMVMLCTGGGCSYQSEGLWMSSHKGFEG
jgi:hypothetical protein